MPARFHAEIESYTFPQFPLSDDCKRTTSVLPVCGPFVTFLCKSNYTHSFVFLEKEKKKTLTDNCFFVFLCVGGCVLPTHMGEG